MAEQSCKEFRERVMQLFAKRLTKVGLPSMAIQSMKS